MAIGSVAAVIVTYNRKALLSQCLDAVLGQTARPDVIYVIDNASSDGTDRLIEANYSGRVVSIRLPKNSGGAGGFYHGMKRAFDDGHAWIWVMDDDVEADAHALEELLAASREAPGAILAPARVDCGGALAEASCVEYDLSHALRLPTAYERSVTATFGTLNALPEVVELENITFEGPLIPRCAIDAAGLPRPEFFIYGDDTEYGVRLREHGFRLLLIGRSRLRRLLVDGRLPPQPSTAWRVRYMVRNPLWIGRVHGTTWGVRNLRGIYWALCIFGYSVARLSWLRRPRHFFSVCRGLWEGLFLPPPSAQTRPAPSCAGRCRTTPA